MFKKKIYQELFTSQAEVCLYEDLHKTFSDITLFDTAYMIQIMLDSPSPKHRKPHPWYIRANTILLYSELYNMFIDTCDWKQIKVKSTNIDVIKNVVNRLSTIKSTIPYPVLYSYMLYRKFINALNKK